MRSPLRSTRRSPLRTAPSALAAGLVAGLALSLAAAPAAAQDDRRAGLFCEARQLPLVSQSLDVRIVGGEAVVRLVQVFANDGEAAAQADYRLHLPAGATVSGFGFWRDDRFLAAELKEKEEARRAHAAAAARGRATGLLRREGTIHSFSVYPVPAGSLQQVETTLRLPVVRESGRSQLRLPLDALLAAGDLPTPATVELETEEPLAAVGIDGAASRLLDRGPRSARLAASSARPVDVWWAEEAPPLLTRAEAVELGDGTLGVQVRIAFNDAGDRRTAFERLVLLVDGSYSMRRRAAAVRDVVARVLERSPRPVEVVSVAERTVALSRLPSAAELTRAALSGEAGFRSSWDELAFAATGLGCTAPAVRCLAVTDPQLAGLPDAEAAAAGGLELLLLADADELAFFALGPESGHAVHQPDAESRGALFARVDEAVLPVLEVRGVDQRGGTFEPLAPARRRVAEGGMLRLVGISRSTRPLELRLAVDGAGGAGAGGGAGDEAVRRVEPELLLADGAAGRALRRSVFAALLDGWMAEYRLHRDPEVRGRIVEVSVREGIPTDLTALHVADLGGRLPAGATAAGLLRRIGVLLLLLGLLPLALYRWTR